MPVVVERVTESCQLGEGPHWDVETQSLYYVDIFGKSIHKYKPSTKEHSKAVIDGPHVSFIIPVEGRPNKYLISIGRQVNTITWDGKSDKVSDIQQVAEVDTATDSLNNRINDAKCDRSGRLWCGTMGPEPEIGHYELDRGSLYSVNPDSKVTHHLSSIGISNGLAWNSDNTEMYYIDSLTGEVHQYDFNLENGSISNKKVIFSFKEAGVDGFPDGQTIDTDGNLWVACFNSSKVRKIDPRKYNTVLQEIDIPAKQITSVAFGGPNLDELYVTSASFPVDGVILAPPNHGAVFKVTGLGVKGYPGVKVKLT